MLNASSNTMFVPPAQGVSDALKPVAPTKSSSQVSHNNPSNQKVQPQEANEHSQNTSAAVKENTHTKISEDVNRSDISSQKDPQSFSNAMSQAMNETENKTVLNASEPLTLNALIDLDPSLKESIPTDLLTKYVESEGKDFEGLEDFLTSQTNETVDLSQTITSDIKHAESLLNTDKVSELSLIAPALLASTQVESQGDITTLSDDVDVANGVSLKTGADSNKNLEQLLQQQKAALTALTKDGTREGSVPLAQTPIAQSVNALSANPLPVNGLPTNTLSADESDLLLSDTESRFDIKSTGSLNLKDSLIGDDSFMKQLQSQMQPKGSNMSANIGQPQMMVDASNAASLVAPSATPPGSAETAAVKTLQIETPVGQGQWSKQFNDQVVWLSSQKIQAASIKLTPTDLGPVEINLKISNEVASIQLIATVHKFEN